MTKTSGWLDTLSVVFTACMIVFVTVWTIQGDFLARVLETDRSMTWQFIRSTGMTAYILFTVSVLWGLALSSKAVKDWSPGTLSMLLHVTVSWLGVGFAAAHALLLLFDRYVPYTLPEILIPFTGPYRAVAVGLGTVTFWVMLLVALSFSIKKRLGHRRWKLLHMSSYAGFFVVTMHAVFAGTDVGKMGFQGMLILAVLSVILLTGYRVRAARAHTPVRAPVRRGQTGQSVGELP